MNFICKIIFISILTLTADSSSKVLAGVVEDGIKAFESNNYQKAVKLLSSVVHEPETNENLRDKINAKAYLGVMYLRGNGVKKSYEKAYQYLSSTAEQNSTASLVLGHWYEDGGWLKKDLNKAKSLYLHSAEFGNRFAMATLGFYYEKSDVKEALKWFRKAVEAGNSYAQVKVDDIVAAEAKAAKFSNTPGVVNNDEIVKSLQQAVKNENPDVMYKFAKMYEKPPYNDKVLAAKWFKKAAILGHKDSQLMMGIYSEQGSVIRESFKDAVKWYRKSAEQGNDVAMYRLSMMYQKGWGIKKSKQLEIYWTKQSAKNGNKQAEYILSLYRKKGYDLTDTYVALAEGADSQEYYDDGMLALRKKKYIQAVNSFRSAAENGHPGAQDKLASLFFEGKGVERSYYYAKQWYEKAANNGNADAQYMMGHINHNKLSGYNDDDLALKWYEMAQHNGDQRAAKFIAAIRYVEPKVEGGSWKDAHNAELHRSVAKKRCEDLRKFNLSIHKNTPSNVGYYVNGKFIPCNS